MRKKYTTDDCLQAFCDCIETGAEGDSFACNLHLEICPDYERLTQIFDDPMYIGFQNVTKSKRRRFVKACEKYLKER